MKKSLSRRDFLKISSVSFLAGLTACKDLTITEKVPINTATPPPTVTPSPTATAFQCSPNEEFYNRLLTLNGERYVTQVPDT